MPFKILSSPFEDPAFALALLVPEEEPASASTVEPVDPTDTVTH
jgi:hypothetical protein